MPPTRGQRSGAGRGRAGAAAGASRDGARGDADAGGRATPNIQMLALGAFAAGALVEKLLSRVIFRREPRGLQKASYCMMLAPPAGPAHTQELKLAHGLCAGGGHRKPQPHPAQQQQPQLHADLLEGFPADEMPMLFDQLCAELGLGGPSPQPWQMPPPPPVAPAPAAPATMAYAARSPLEHAAAALLLAPPVELAAPRAGPPVAGTPAKRVNRHTANEAARRNAFNALLEDLRKQTGGVQEGSTKAEVVEAARLRIAQLQADLAVARAAVARTTKADAAQSDGAGFRPLALGPLHVSSGAFGGDSAADLDSADSEAPGTAVGSGGGFSPLSPTNTDGAAAAAAAAAAAPGGGPGLLDGPVQVEVTDSVGEPGAALAPAATLVARVTVPCDASGAAPQLATTAAALGLMPLALRNAALCSSPGAPGTPGRATLTFELEAAPGMPAGTRACDVRDALAAQLNAATARRAAGADVAADVAAALGLQAAAADGKRRRTD